MRIGVDLDGVLYDFVGALREYAISVNYHEDQLPPNKTWDFHNEWGMSLGEWKSLVREGVEAGVVFRVGSPSLHAPLVLGWLRAQGHTIHIVTHREWGTKSHTNTEAWLKAWEIPYDSITYAQDKTLVPTDIFVDDHVANLDALRAAGTVAVAFDRPWNEEWSGLRVSTWRDFHTLVRSFEEEEKLPRIIGLSGYAQAGKDTVASALVNEFGYERAAFADPLRQVLYALNPIVFCLFDENYRVQDLVDGMGWDKAKTEHPEIRALLQRLGTEGGRNILGENVWVDAAMRKLDPEKRYAFTDVRFPNEFHAVLEAGDGNEMWRIVRQDHGPVNDHPSETALDTDFRIGNFDQVIDNNNGTDLEALRVEVRRALGRAT